MQREDVAGLAMRGLENPNSMSADESAISIGCGGAQIYLSFAETRTSAGLSVVRMDIN